MKQNKKHFLKKFLIIILLALAAFYGFEYFKKERNLDLKNKELQKFRNIESEIFSLSEDHKNHDSNYVKFDENKISELSVNELKEAGAEFIYQLLLYNQVQISKLKSDLEVLRVDFKKYKAQEKITKIILFYVQLRQKIWLNQNYSQELKNLEILASKDDKLMEKINILENNLIDFANYETLQQEFKKTIPDLIATKNHNSDGGFIDKARYAIAKIIVIRKLSENGNDIDAIIFKIENNLKNYNCSEALNNATLADKKYQKILEDFTKKLQKTCEVEKIDKEILLYLENLI